MIFFVFILAVTANLALAALGLVPVTYGTILLHFFSIALGVVAKTLWDQRLLP